MKKYNKHFIVLGSARSGTSWFSELIARQYRYRMLFEPEHEFNTQDGKLICDRYITEENNDNNVKEYLNKVFRNRIDNDWIAQHSNRKWKRHLWPFIPIKFIIKFVRCNLMANYLSTNFNIPIVYIIRNPYEVLASQQRVKFPWLYNLKHFQEQENLCQLIEKEFGLNIRHIKEVSDLEKLCIRWCIENTVSLLQKERTLFDVYKYEDIVSDVNVFLKICKDYNIQPLTNIEAVYKLPSSKTHPKSEIVGGKKILKPFTDEEYQLIDKYLDIFRIHFYERATK